MATIVRITDFKLSALQGLRAESVHEGFSFVDRLCAEWVSGANRFDAPGEALFLAVNDGQVVGVCGLNCDPYAHDPLVGRVRRLYVSRAHRHRGIGRALLEAVVACARGHFNLLRVRTEAAGDFFTAQGFRHIASGTEVTHVLELSGLAEPGSRQSRRLFK